MFYVDMGTRDLSSWKPNQIAEGHFDIISVERNKSYVVGGGDERIVLIDFKTLAVFWTFPLKTERVLDIRPEADMCFFRSTNKGWSAISLLRSYSTGGVPNSTVNQSV